MSISIVPSGEQNKPNVLIIDDEQKICTLIKLFLDQTHLFKNVVVAESVSIALLKIRNEYFDLVIVDYNLPDKKGTSFIDIISKSYKFRKVKFLMISGYIDDQAMMDVVQVGLKNLLVKPFSRAALIQKVCEILKLLPE